MMCSRALSWKRIGPFLLIGAGCRAAGLAVFSNSFLLSMFLRCNGFARIQKAVVGQKGSRPPNSDRDHFWCKSGFRKCLELLLSPATEPVIVGCHIKSTFRRTSQLNKEMILCCCVRVREDNT